MLVLVVFEVQIHIFFLPFFFFFLLQTGGNKDEDGVNANKSSGQCNYQFPYSEMYDTFLRLI